MGNVEDGGVGVVPESFLHATIPVIKIDTQIVARFLKFMCYNCCNDYLEGKRAIILSFLFYVL
jgi:hypothetical protein